MIGTATLKMKGAQSQNAADTAQKQEDRALEHKSVSLNCGHKLQSLACSTECLKWAELLK